MSTCSWRYCSSWESIVSPEAGKGRAQREAKSVGHPYHQWHGSDLVSTTFLPQWKAWIRYELFSRALSNHRSAFNLWRQCCLYFLPVCIASLYTNLLCVHILQGKNSSQHKQKEKNSPVISLNRKHCLLQCAKRKRDLLTCHLHYP